MTAYRDAVLRDDANLEEALLEGVNHALRFVPTQFLELGKQFLGPLLGGHRKTGH